MALPRQLSLATVNLENLHLPRVPFYSKAEGWSEEEYAGKRAWTAQALQRLNADIIGFQELWHRDALADAFTLAGLADEYEIATVDPVGNAISNAIAVRKPHRLVEMRWIEAFPERMTLRRRHARSLADTDYTLNVGIRDFSRPLAHATIEVRHPRVTRRLEVLAAHLKSKLPTPLERDDAAMLQPGDADALGSALSTIRRAAEAAALRLVCNALLRDGTAAVAVLGDLNDAHRSVTTELIAGPHRYRLFAASRAGEQASRGLYATATLQQHRSQRDVYYTYIHEGAHDSLDHILVSQHFYDYSRARLWSFREMRVLNDDLDDPRRQERHASDHAPVVATFDHNPA
jgi:predicted extracellular nuclease